MAKPVPEQRHIPLKDAKKLKTASARVEKHAAHKTAPLLRQAFDELGSLVKLLADMHVEADQALANEIRILLETLRRFRKRVSTAQQARTAALEQADRGLLRAMALLTQVAEAKVGLVRLEDESARDLSTLQKLRRNVKQRGVEAAFVLAELEQAADPLPGLKIASAKVRRENAKKRAAMAAPRTEVVVNPDALTSKPISEK